MTNAGNSERDFSGMTLNERLFSCGLVDRWDAAARAGRKEEMVALLVEVGITAHLFFSVHGVYRILMINSLRLGDVSPWGRHFTQAANNQRLAACFFSEFYTPFYTNPIAKVNRAKLAPLTLAWTNSVRTFDETRRHH